MVISAYRPVKNTTEDLSVYNQQREKLDSCKRPRDECPRTAFTKDLKKLCDKFHANGDTIIIAMDASKTQLFKPTNPIEDIFQEQNIKDCILHQNHRDSAPETSSTGSKPVDTRY
jgi:hypothetical protein